MSSPPTEAMIACARAMTMGALLVRFTDRHRFGWIE